MRVLQHGVQRDPVMGLRQVVTGHADMEAVVVEPAHRGVVAGPPGYAPGFHAGHRLAHGPRSAAELQHVATDEVAVWVGFVELLAPERDDGTALALQPVIDPAMDDRPGMEHQVAPDLAR